MKDKLLDSVKASWPYLLTLIIGLYLAEILAGSVMALSHYKLTFADHMPTVLKQLALHPWHYYNLYLGQKNPVLKELSDHYFSINAKDLTTAFNKSTKAEILKSLVNREKSAKGGD